MGCDIHTFVEYADFHDQNGDPHWSCMSGSYNPGRDYTMFGLLAGVRGSEALIDPRGLPDGKMSYQVEDYMRVRIVSDEEHKTSGGDAGVTLTTAQSWKGETIVDNHEGKPRWVTNPDLHGHSWLTADELRLVLAYYILGDEATDIDIAPEDRLVVMQAAAALLGGGESYAPGWDAIVAAMAAFEARGCKTRLIFCFDN